MKNKRRNKSAQFKAKVSLAAAKGDKTIAKLASEFDYSSQSDRSMEEEETVVAITAGYIFPQ